MTTVAALPPPTTFGGMTVEAERLDAEARALRAGIEKAEEKLSKLSSRLEALTTLVDKQHQHLQQLKARAQEGQVIFLPDYREMKLKHHQHRKSIAESQVTIASIKTDLKVKRASLALVDAKLKEMRGALDGWGKLLLLRCP